MLEVKDKGKKSDLMSLILPQTKSKSDTNSFFAQLLSGAKENLDKNLKEIIKEPKVGKTVQKSTFVEQKNIADIEVINPALLKMVDKKELLTLISKAKDYLTQKITQTPEYKELKIQELPKNLDGLLKVAKLLDIDISKITLEVLQEQKPNVLDKTKDFSIPKEQTAKDIKQHFSQEQKQIIDQKQNDPTIKEESLSEHVKLEQNKSVQIEPKIQSKKPSLSSLLSDNIVQDKPIDSSTNVIKKEVIAFFNEEKPLSSEHIAQTKESIKEPKKETQKEPKKESLETLLKSKSTNLFEEDKSIKPVILDAPIISNETNTKESEVKSEVVVDDAIKPKAIHKSEVAEIKQSLGVKINEAKQMIRYLADDVKNAIDNYKSPFTRLKVQLNPQHLGEIDLMVVSRGKNLHVNLTSNNSAINILSSNVSELRTQLNNSGINNASLHFSDNSQNSNESGFSQQNRQNQQKKAKEEYNYFSDDEENLEVLSSLEIVVPHYI